MPLILSRRFMECKWRNLPVKGGTTFRGTELSADYFAPIFKISPLLWEQGKPLAQDGCVCESDSPSVSNILSRHLGRKIYSWLKTHNKEAYHTNSWVQAIRLIPAAVGSPKQLRHSYSHLFMESLPLSSHITGKWQFVTYKP